MKRGALLIVALLMAMTIMAQKTAVSGTVVDASTGQPVMGASVTAGDVSVVTNADGYFTLKSEQQPEAVVVTHVGYRSRRVAVTGSQLTVRLDPTVVQLHEVLVMADNPLELVRAAIRQIPQNYSRTAELSGCFYRETAMKRQHYITVAEGVVSMYKGGVGAGMGLDRVAISKGRRLLSQKQGDTLGVKVLGGPVAAVQLDVVKNRDFLLNDEDLGCYKLTMEMPTTIADRPQYVVSLAPRVTMPYALYNGRLYIDQETLAFTRVELSLDMDDRRKATEAMLVKKPSGVRFRPRELSLLVDYRQGADGVMRLSYMRMTFRFNCDWRRRLFATSFTATCEMAVTSTTDRDVRPIRGRDSFDQRDAFFDRVDYFRDPTFWADYNIIEPTESLDKAVQRLLKKNQN